MNTSCIETSEIEILKYNRRGLGFSQHHNILFYHGDYMFRSLDHHLYKTQNKVTCSSNKVCTIWDAIRLSNVLKYIKTEYDETGFLPIMYWSFIKVFFVITSICLETETKFTYIEHLKVFLLILITICR